MLIVKLKNKIKKYPKLKNKILVFLNLFPNTKVMLRGLVSTKVNYGKWKSSSDIPELLVDISHLYKEDLKTGVQRVVRAILSCLEINKDLNVQPIYLTDEDGFWCFKYVKSPKTVVVPKKGDVFLGLDLNGAIFAPDKMGLFEDWKKRELDINFVIYDILPIQFPYFWTPDVEIAHTLWLDTTIRNSNKLICISKAVSEDVKEYIKTHKNKFYKTPQVEWFHLGADIDSSQPSKGIPIGAEALFEKLEKSTSFLMVSTIEPRKGHKQTLRAFEQLWADGSDSILIIVGKLGWMMDDFKNTLDEHPQKDKKIFWLEGVSDEYLNKVYQSSTCLLAASEGEGFGLPLIEAAQYKKPIIARDIPVFREVAGEYAHFFTDTNKPEEISETIQQWLMLYKDNKHKKSDRMPWLTWEKSAKQLMERL